MFIGADIFIHSLHTFRNVWMQGRYGGGKTLLSVALADYFHKKWGYTTFSNLAVYGDHVIDEPVYCEGDDVLCTERCKDFPKLHSFIIYDEAWMSLGSGASPKQVRSYLAYLRKVDVIMVSCSVMDLSRNSYFLWVQRKYNFGTVGLPLWVYEWGLPRKTSKVSGGHFGLWWPQQYYNTYETDAQPDDLEYLFRGDLRKKR